MPLGSSKCVRRFSVLGQERLAEGMNGFAVDACRVSSIPAFPPITLHQSWGKADPPHVYQTHLDPVIASSHKYTNLFLGLTIPRFDYSGQTTQLPTVSTDTIKGAALHTEELGTVQVSKIANPLISCIMYHLENLPSNTRFLLRGLA